jgi:transposase
MSMPGTGFVSATAILAEIGNYTDFENSEQLAAWCSRVPFFISISRKDHPLRDNQTRLQAYSKNVDSSRLCYIANQGFQAEEFF